MKTTLRKILKWSGILLGIFVIFLILLRLEIIGNPILNMSFRYSDHKILEEFRNDTATPIIGRIPFEGKQIRYLLLQKDESLPFVVFIHGAPGSSIDYLEFFKDEKLYAHFNLLSIDRLGYGYSDFGHSETSLRRQGEALMEVIETVCKNSRIILVGHSYGGPITLSMASEYPGSFTKIMLLAPAIDPDNEKEIKIASLGVNRLTRWMVPPALQVAADEKMTHISELKKLKPSLAAIKVPICHIHGTKDSLVPYENLAFSEEHFKNDTLETVTLENVDHFLPWTHHELIVEKLLQFKDDAFMNINAQDEN